MTAQGEDILAWLERAITHAETTARAAAAAVGGAGWDGWDREVAVDLPGGDTVADGVMYGDMYEPMKAEACTHIALHDPALVLRRCTADRKILELHGRRGHSCPAHDYDGDLDEHARFYDHEVCPVVQHLADGYGWTAGQTPPSEGEQMT
ncbi:DUF6221 family protein [Streptomyces chilikensis]|uniref:DUF6221 family protein n=1 Tax=Streptomyces chilikensis TaxID=1194079 RepID=A0ABV3ERD7_9ACTN